VLLLLLAPTDSRGNFHSFQLEVGRDRQDQAQWRAAYFGPRPKTKPKPPRPNFMVQGFASLFYLPLRPGLSLASGVYSFTSLGTASAAELSIHLFAFVAIDSYPLASRPFDRFALTPFAQPLPTSRLPSPPRDHFTRVYDSTKEAKHRKIHTTSLHLKHA
jgi:hypothetical protein